MAKFMLNSDAFAWQMEADAALRSTVVSVVMLDRSPDHDLLLARFRRICDEVPMFRERVVETLPPAPPRWELDPDLDLDWHARRVTAPAPGTLDTVLEMARRAQMAEFDRARPLWEVTVVDGLTDGAAALVCKLHHSLSDGIGAVQLSRILFDLPLGPGATGGRPETPAPPSRLDPWTDPLRYDLSLVGRAAHLGLRTAPAALLHAVRRPVASTRATAGMTASVYRMVRPINHCGSPIMTERRLIRRLGTHQVPLAALKAAGRQGGGTLNDAFLAGVAAGLRRYHDRHGVPIEDLHVTMPLSTRSEHDPIGGNRLTLMRFDLPVGLTDPADLVGEIHERVAAVRAEPSLPYTQAIAAGLNLLPRWYLASVLRHVDFLASDVPGLPVPVRLGDARVTMQYPVGPTIGAGVNVTLMTYVDTCALGIDVDVGAIPDVDEFHACLVAGFEEVLALAPTSAA
ncbi:wax ester/triacylglycerol synthase domain-containing protein [Nocardioides rubriscoriae]|uniref:wax ester/triacylglycerol synthase domain-containing protein n=1 Tax=Nocardioides rubriscoriae TaxID=642762 RepID=UPI0011DFA47A|nr:wax ester/triacylglycerol synthase domain-containing protein [Nocardioides rubriscoriae]